MMKRRNKVLITILLAVVVIGLPQWMIYLATPEFKWVGVILSVILGYIGGTIALLLWLDEIQGIGLK